MLSSVNIGCISKTFGFVMSLHKMIIFHREHRSPSLRRVLKFAFLNAVTLRDKSDVTLKLFIAQSENDITTWAIVLLSLLFG